MTVAWYRIAAQSDPTLDQAWQRWQALEALRVGSTAEAMPEGEAVPGP